MNTQVNARCTYICVLLSHGDEGDLYRKSVGIDVTAVDGEANA